MGELRRQAITCSMWGDPCGRWELRGQAALVWMKVLEEGVETVRLGSDTVLAVADVVPALLLQPTKSCPPQTPATPTPCHPPPLARADSTPCPQPTHHNHYFVRLG